MSGLRQKAPSAQQILSACAAAFGQSEADIMGHCRRVPLVRPRQALCLMLRWFVTAGGVRRSLPEIGREMGRDHSTVLVAVNKALHLAGCDAGFAARLRQAAELALELAGQAQDYARLVPAQPDPAVQQAQQQARELAAKRQVEAAAAAQPAPVSTKPRNRFYEMGDAEPARMQAASQNLLAAIWRSGGSYRAAGAAA